MSKPSDLDPSSNDIQQSVHGDRNQTIGQVLGGMIVYVSGGQAIINTGWEEATTDNKAIPIGPNPYRGLMAFQETDGDRFFGREKQIAALWANLRSLHETEAAIRILPIYGPSGSGKSSLARAGLIPELARHPIPGYDRARVAILVPGSHPLESLATVLARIVTQDLTPVAKTREFAGELKQGNETGEYDGLRRIADVMPDIAIAPLVVLVDQFEEVYTLCEDKAERDAFIGNLLHAAGDRAKRVTVIVTLRSDFLGETQKHAVLNRLFSEQGYLVPAMTPEELRQAIAKPAELADNPLDTATIDLLVKDTEGREGALPLLQFALTRIWEGLAEGKQPAETLQAIGGVGGALAGEAQRIYDSLDEEGKAIARRLFLGLVQLGEGTKDTRCRALIDSLISYKDQPTKVRQVINQFAAPGVRLITLAGDRNAETVEITHEALFEHWQQFQTWLDESRDDIRFQRRLDESARYWDKQGRQEGLLWRSPSLESLQDYSQRAPHEMTILQIEFFETSQNLFHNIQKLKRIGVLSLIFGLLITISTAGFAVYQLQQVETQRYEAERQRNEAERQRVEQLVASARVLLFSRPTEALLTAISAVGSSKLNTSTSSTREMSISVQEILIESVQASREIEVLNFNNEIESVAFSPREELLAIGTGNKLYLADLEGNSVGQPFEGHQETISSVAFSPNGDLIASGSADQTIRLWDLKGIPIGQPFTGHQASVVSVAFSPDGKVLVSGGSSDDSYLRFWDINGNLIKQHYEESLAPIWSVDFSPDGKFIATGSHNGILRLWDSQGTQLWQRSRDNDWRIYSVAFSSDGQSILNGSISDYVTRWNLEGDLINYPISYEHPAIHLAISDNSGLIVAGDNHITANSFQKPLLGHESTISSIAVSPDGRFVVSGDIDGTLRIWDLENPPIGQEIRQGSPIQTSEIATQRIANIRLNEDGTTQLSDSQYNDIGQPLQTKTSDDIDIVVVAASINSSRNLIATVSENGLVYLWDTQGNLLDRLNIRPITSADEFSYSITFSANDGQIILSKSKDGIGDISFYDLEGSLVGSPISGYPGSISSIDSTVTGELILTLDSGRRWSLTWQDWLKAACNRLQYHSEILNPTTDTAEEAKRTCQQYVWEN